MRRRIAAVAFIQIDARSWAYSWVERTSVSHCLTYNLDGWNANRYAILTEEQDAIDNPGQPPSTRRPAFKADPHR